MVPAPAALLKRLGWFDGFNGSNQLDRQMRAYSLFVPFAQDLSASPMLSHPTP
ncbi:MAG: hypothetical protein JWO88_3942 [Frankiales bacterium]|nr:hypothetical protein [Frankiales bacterium]